MDSDADLVFAELDVNDDGRVCPDDIIAAFSSWGVPLTEDDAIAVIVFADRGQLGFLTREDVAAMLEESEDEDDDVP